MAAFGAWVEQAEPKPKAAAKWKQSIDRLLSQLGPSGVNLTRTTCNADLETFKTV